MFPPTKVPSNEYLPPSDEGYHYSKPKQSKQLKNGKSNALQVQIDNMRCLEGRDGYFQVSLAVQSFIDNLPIIDMDTNDQRCQLHLIGVKFLLSIPANDFQRCNVFPCGPKDLCVRLRFPQIYGMKSLDDGLLTLQCRIQERIVAKTHTLRIGVANTK